MALLPGKNTVDALDVSLSECSNTWLANSLYLQLSEPAPYLGFIAQIFLAKFAL
jgi:hypothetical protein